LYYVDKQLESRPIIIC